MADFRARLVPKPGSFMADGAVVTINGGRTQRGPVCIDAKRLPSAYRFGWRVIDHSAGHLVQIERLKWRPGQLLPDGLVVDCNGVPQSGGAWVPLEELSAGEREVLGVAGWCIARAVDWPGIPPRSGLWWIYHRA